MLSVPISNSSLNRETRPIYLSELQRSNADRVFICFGHTFGVEPDTSELIFTLKENVEYFKESGFEVGVWLNGLGHGGDVSPRYKQAAEKFTKITGLGNGGGAGDSFCPLDPEYRGFFKNFITKLAETQAEIIMIDDDLRLSIHGTAMIGCACERHLGDFSKRIGRKYTREQAAEKVFSGLPCRERNVWLETMGDSMRSFLSDLREAVNSVNPKIRLGHCACLPTWGLDGIDSIEMSRILAGNTKPFLRFIGAPYWNTKHSFGTNNLGAVIDAERMQAEWCRQTAPEIEVFEEGDAYPRPRYNCPSVFVEDYDQVLSADGCTDGILKYMIDYYHSPHYETGYIDRHELLAQTRKEITEAFRGLEPSGVYVFEKMNKFYEMDCTERSEGDLATMLIPPAARFCEGLGIPTSFTMNKNTKAAFVFGENARFISEIPENIPLVIDGTAAEILFNSGFDIGVSRVAGNTPQSTEIFTDGEAVPIDSAMKLYSFELSENARIISKFGNNTPASYTYTSENGSEMLVYAFSAEMSDPNSPLTVSYERQRTLFTFLEKRSAIPAMTRNQFFLYQLCKKSEKAMAVGLWNFSRELALPGIIKLDGHYSSIKPIAGTKCDLISTNTVSVKDAVYPYGFAGFVVSK